MVSVYSHPDKSNVPSAAYLGGSTDTRDEEIVGEHVKNWFKFSGDNPQVASAYVARHRMALYVRTSDEQMQNVRSQKGMIEEVCMFDFRRECFFA